VHTKTIKQIQAYLAELIVTSRDRFLHTSSRASERKSVVNPESFVSCLPTSSPMDAWTTVLSRLLAQQQWRGDAGTIDRGHRPRFHARLDAINEARHRRTLAASPGKLLRYSSQEWILC
jgi:hypothetical protein